MLLLEPVTYESTPRLPFYAFLYILEELRRLYVEIARSSEAQTLFGGGEGGSQSNGHMDLGSGKYRMTKTSSHIHIPRNTYKHSKVQKALIYQQMWHQIISPFYTVQVELR